MFKITVEEITTESYKGTEYRIVSDTGDGQGRERKYEYIPAECVRETETKLLEQTVQVLDLIAVIKAVNRIT